MSLELAHVSVVRVRVTPPINAITTCAAAAAAAEAAPAAAAAAAAATTAASAPDVIETGAAANGNHVLYEAKVWTSLKNTKKRGTGYQGGGTVATDKGHQVAFGCVEEDLLVTCLGTGERGRRSDGAFDHKTGRGFVAARPGDYTSAIKDKHNSVVVIIGNPMGGVTKHARFLLRQWAKDAKAGRDGTVYGSSETVGDFFPHHAAAISMAPVRYEAEAIVNGATKREARLAQPGCRTAATSARM